MADIVQFVPAPGEALTMTSREIAELTGKRHHHVVRDARRMLAALGEGETKFGFTYRDAQGKAQVELRLPKDLTLTLVSGYSVELRHRIVTRWQELEAAVATAAAVNLDDPATLRRLLDRQATLRIEEQAQLAETSATLARLTEAEGSFTISEAAKMLGVGQKALFGWLSDHRWIYRRTHGSPWLGYASKLRAGLLEHVEYLQPQEDGGEKARIRVRVTPKGAAELARLVPAAPSKERAA